MGETNYSFGLLAAMTVAALAACLLALVVSVEPARAALPGTNGKIAYQGWDGSRYQIYTISSMGGTSRQLTTDYGTQPTYSPDGTKIAYSGYDGSSTEQLYTIPVLVGAPTQITKDTRGPHRQPTYSPDGKTIAYEGRDSSGYTQIYTIP